jgi:hypothetical protein
MPRTERVLTTHTLWIQKEKDPLVTVSDTGVAADPVHNIRNVPPSDPSVDTTLPQMDQGVKSQDTQRVSVDKYKTQTKKNHSASSRRGLQAPGVPSAK